MNPLVTGRRLLCLVAVVGLLYGCDNDTEPGPSDDAGVDSTTAPSRAEATPSPDSGTSSETSEGESAPAIATADRSGTLKPEPPLEIDGLMKSDDVASVADGKDFRTTKLPGREPGPNYNAQRLRPPQGDDYGAGLQVWSFSSEKEAKKRLEELRSQYLAVQDPPDSAGPLADSGFVSARSGIRNFVFSVDSPARVVAVSCSEAVCDSNETLAKLARRVAGRVRSNSGSAKGAGTDGESESNTGGSEESDQQEKKEAAEKESADDSSD